MQEGIGAPEPVSQQTALLDIAIVVSTASLPLVVVLVTVVCFPVSRVVATVVY